MKVTIKKEVFKKLPQLKIVFFLVKDFDNKKRLKESKHLLKEMEKLIRFTFHKETIKNHHLISPWQVAREEFGKKAYHYHTSLEQILKRILKKKVNVSNEILNNLIKYLAVKHLVPYGIDDSKKINKNLTFALAKRKGKKGIFKSLKKGDFYYHDEKNILGTKLDYWKNSKTKLNKKSTSALIHFEILPPMNQKKTTELSKETLDLIKIFTNGKVKKFVLSKTKNSVKI